MGDVACTVDGRLGRIHLSRPKALNALTHPMVVEIGRALARWRDDDRVVAVLVTGEGERAFCAGGDVREVWQLGKVGRIDEAMRFFFDEYRMNWRIHHFPKPYIALVDGIVMGGGVGLSAHGSHRVASDGTLFAMPETAIGMFPDVGATWLLGGMEGGLGRWLALTGARLGPGDTVAAGVATHFVPRAKLGLLHERLAGVASGTAAVDVVEELAETAPAVELAAHGAAIAAVFGHDDLHAVRDAAASEPTGWGAKQWHVVAGRSPTSVKLAHAQLLRGQGLDFAACLQLEYRMVRRILEGHDFYEGIRAVLVDKDQHPRWQPATLDAVSDAAIHAYFAPLPGGDLMFDWTVD